MQVALGLVASTEPVRTSGNGYEFGMNCVFVLRRATPFPVQGKGEKPIYERKEMFLGSRVFKEVARISWRDRSIF